MARAANSVHVDPSNAEQTRAWDGDEGRYWATNAERFDQAVAVHHHALFERAGIGATDQVFDVGCGTGQTTRTAARAAASGSALGVDLSSQMIELARRLAVAEGIANARFEQADAQSCPFTADTYEIAISRTGAMFFGDPVAAFGNIGRALRPRGRLVLLVWQAPARNEWIRELATALAAGRNLPLPPADAPGPFSMADPERVRGILNTAGFAGVQFEGLSAPMYFGADANDAFGFVQGLLGWMLEGLDAAGRQRALQALRNTLAAHADGAGVRFDSAAWIITGRKG